MRPARHGCLGSPPRRWEDYPLPLTRRAIRPPPGFPHPPAGAGEGIPQGGTEPPSRGPTPWRAAPRAEGTLPGCPGGLPPAHGWGFHPLPTRPAAGFPGMSPFPHGDPSRVAHPQDPRPRSLGVVQWDRTRGLYPLERPVECRASPHFRRHAASPATSTRRHAHQLSGPGATRVRVRL